jgi:arginyl-tRNA--protein-N-Asp/Glu arginylyltransferase
MYKSDSLDYALADGYFRMGNDIFTTNEVFVGNYGKSAIYDPVFWLRVNLKKAKETATTKRIRKKCARFSFTIQEAEITEEIESLYSVYLNSVNFDGYPSCKACIPELNNPAAAFDTHMITIRDQGNLIGVGFFDVGKKALMSVLHFYHPDYKRFSIGKFLMLITKEFANDCHMDFVYPGYFTIDGTKMDYKIFPQIEAIEVFLSKDKSWVPLENYSKLQLEDYYFKQVLGIDFDNLQDEMG